MAKKCPNYTYEGGRTIYKDGKPFIGITREGDTRPVVADRIARSIAAWLKRTCKK